MAVLLTSAAVMAALADVRRGKSYDLIDSRVPGLMLRVKPRGARWSIRARLRGEQRRWDLGPAVDGREDTGEAICLETARSKAMEIRSTVREERDPAVVLAFLRGGKSAVDELRQAEADALNARLAVVQAEAKAARPTTWTWEEAKLQYWDELTRANRGETLRDYRTKLGVPEFTSRFAGRPVCEISDVEIAEAYGEVFRRAEPMADGCLRTVKAFWSFLSSADRRSLTGVATDLRTVRFKPRTRVEDGDPNKAFDPDDEVGDAPEPLQLGIALAIARCPGALEPHEANALLLLLASCQRRRAVMGATTDRFRRYPTAPDEQAWYVAPFFRKTRTKRGSKSHLVPVLSFGAEAVLAQERTVNDSTWLFHNGRAGDVHRNVNSLNKLLDALPGVDWSPHAPRYALADFVVTLQGFEKSDASLILDHSEGTEPSDVTATYYASNTNIAKKRSIMEAWIEHLKNLEAEAVRANPLLRDVAWIRRQVFMARNGLDRTEKRETDRTAKGLPVW